MAMRETIEVPDATYRLIGGDPVLDLVNTASWYRAPARSGRDYLDLVGKERLVIPADLLRWGITAGVVSATAARGSVSPTGLVRARLIRRALHRLFKGVIEGWPAESADLAALDRELEVARTNERLAARGNAFRWEWRTTPVVEDLILWTMARRAADLLTSEHLGQIRECGGEDCGWLFLDSTRNHSRRWCEMADCGNLAKVRRFRDRN